MNNQVRTVFLLGLLTGLLLLVGDLIGGNQGLFVGLIFAFVVNFGSYWFSDRIVLAMYHAKPVNESYDYELWDLVKDVSHLANIPMPKVYIVNSTNPNAFATGRNPQHATVAVTTGIKKLLTKDELRGVIAHEISHIKNRDTLIQTVSASIAGVISYVAFVARWSAFFGGFGGDSRDSNVLELLVLAILTPFLATLIRLAISRSREFLADESAAKTLHNGLSLASALEKLDLGIKHFPLRANSQTETTAHLFIANPFKNSGFVRIFSTHPPIKERVKKLRDGTF